ACSSSRLPDDPTAEQRFRAAMEDYHDEDYLDALQHFDVIRLQHPGSSVYDSARYFAGMSRFKLEDYLLASYEFNQVRAGNPSSELLADAQYMYARSYVELSPKPALDQTYTLRAIDALQTFIELYPTHPMVGEATEKIKDLITKLAEKEYRIAQLYLKLESPLSAIEYLDTIIDKYYNTPFVDDAMYDKIQIQMRRKKYDEVKALVQEFLAKYKDSPYFEDVKELYESGALTSTE
ncbi:MAG: outer membrane protein assembly factor BamD, partial [Ectothiorhodospiraceae bacterium]|nr:outer membrane protein assembly factor BamD [Ectothiorhodospiraceae bacterium]